MILKKVHITEFKSIRDSNEFEVGDITCLVGKNESGKTALLQALYRLEPIQENEGNFNITEDFPRMDVTNYELAVKRKEREVAQVVKATYELEDADVKEINQLYGNKALINRELILEKYYDNETKFRLEFDEEAILEFLIDGSGLDPNSIQELKKCNDEKEILAWASKVEQTQAIVSLVKKIEPFKEEGISHYIYNTYIDKNVPKFLYFDEYYQMDGCANIGALIKRKNENSLKHSDYPLLGLINLARLELDELATPKNTQELKNRLQGASNHLTAQTISYWSQNKHLRMEFDVRHALPQDPFGMQEGINIWAEVYDEAHRVSTGLGTRSRGFVWFFSFLAWYSDLLQNNQPMILLLDEPGLFLHAKAQEDLLQYFESQVKGKHQLIYTTHSPFMVDSRHFDRVRIVEDKSIDSDVQLPLDKQGTKVYTNVLEVSEDSLFPLQGALGYEIHQTLFVGPHCLIIEGPSDLLYIQSINGILERKGREGLDSRWTLTPVGGADKVPTFVALLGGQKNLNIATLIDIDNDNAQSVENLYKSKLLAKKNVLTFAEFVKNNSADIEDMFENDFYLQLVNSEYSKSLSKKIDMSNLNNNIPRILVRIEEYLAANPMKNDIKFNHYRPARYLTENLSTLENSISDTTLERFESAFKKLNSLLPSK